MDGCHGQHVQHHVNHVIMSTTHHQLLVGKCNSSETCEFTDETLSGQKPWFFFRVVASAVVEGESLFPRFGASILESCRQKVHGTVARARFALQNVKLTASEHF